MRQPASLAQSPNPMDLIVLDVEQLRRESYRMMLVLVVLLGWGVTFVAAYHLPETNRPMRISLLLLIGAAISAALKRSWPRLARFTLSLTLMCAYIFAVFDYPSGAVPYLGALALMSVSGMLSSLSHGALTGSCLLSIILAHLVFPSPGVTWMLVGRVSTVLGLGVFVSWLSRRHLDVALRWASSSISRSLALAEQLRDRQQELNRILRAMDEANARLALVNQRLQEAREAAEEGQAAKARFAASISHELRTPLNLIIGFAEVMYGMPHAYPDTLLSANFVRDLGVVYRNAQHLRRLVDDVLDLAQLDTSKITMQLVETDISSLLHEAVSTVGTLVSARGLDFTLSIPPELPTVRVDRTRIKQVLLNLLSNAARYTASGGITLMAQTAEEELEISVSDTGPGIPADKLERIFEEFEKSDSVMVGGERGFGLGLAISRRIVQGHGGRIWAESQVGVGSTFTFTLPLRGPLLTSRWVKPDRAQAASHEEALDTVVVVTPSVTAARLFSRHLHGYRCVIGRTLDQAVLQVRQLRPRGLILDSRFAADREQMVDAAQREGSEGMPVMCCPMPTESRVRDFPMVTGYLVKPVVREAFTDVLRTVQKDVESILIVDDDDDVLRLFRQFLMDTPTRPYRITTVHSGHEALQMLDRARPDLIFLDLIMPMMDGYQFMVQLQNRQMDDIQIIIISGQDVTEEDLEVVGEVSVVLPRHLGVRRLLGGISGFLKGLDGAETTP